ncbi:6648_t:CDS:2 [Funneliformis geosporum]|uniref:18382_t:CDS:1 n=1 Tax=Funneliformis geosporum TaxID=1117311 RepID=A0A9W4T3C5_9GLOM|nr:18382_t:CDS:2 [Funneliformis geosporum]CAI2192270.1 6648_t:CDS:2 [Funneliformis geosporum]
MKFCQTGNFESFNVQLFWKNLNVREEKVNTQTAQVILQEKEEQNACQVRSNMLDENIQVLSKKRRKGYSTPPHKNNKHGVSSTRIARIATAIHIAHILQTLYISDSRFCDYDEKSSRL